MDFYLGLLQIIGVHTLLGLSAYWYRGGSIGTISNCGAFLLTFVWAISMTDVVFDSYRFRG